LQLQPVKGLGQKCLPPFGHKYFEQADAPSRFQVINCCKVRVLCAPARTYLAALSGLVAEVAAAKRGEAANWHSEEPLS
jgi:hypothetical protein